MRIEINEPGSEAFYREVVNVSGQHRRLMRKPEAKLRDHFRALRVNIILCAVFLALNLVMALTWGADTLSWVAGVLMVFCIALNGGFLMQYHRLLRALMARDGAAVLTVDESGVELDREGVQKVRLDWSTVAFVRVFQESLCFVPREAGSLLVAVDRKYAAQVLEELRHCAPDVKVY